MVILEGLIPFEQIIDRRIDAAVAENSAGEVLVGALKRVLICE